MLPTTRALLSHRNGNNAGTKDVISWRIRRLDKVRSTLTMLVCKNCDRAKYTFPSETPGKRILIHEFAKARGRNRNRLEA